MTASRSDMSLYVIVPLIVGLLGLMAAGLQVLPAWRVSSPVLPTVVWQYPSEGYYVFEADGHVIDADSNIVIYGNRFEWSGGTTIATEWNATRTAPTVKGPDPDTGIYGLPVRTDQDLPALAKLPPPLVESVAVHVGTVMVVLTKEAEDRLVARILKALNTEGR